MNKNILIGIMNRLNYSYFKVTITGIIRLATIILPLGVNLLTYGQTNKLANTLLWEISGNGMPKPSYLFGTMHVSDRIAFHLQDSFFMALQNVDYVALEQNPELWLDDMLNSKTYDAIKNMATMFMNNTPDYYDEMLEFNPFNSRLLKSALAESNQLVNNLLYRFGNGMNINYQEGTYLDMYIYQTGKKLNKEIVGLEEFEQSMQMVIKAMIPDDDKEKVKSRTGYENYNNTFTIFEQIEKAYRRGDLNDIDSLMNLTYISANFKKYFITGRNKIMLHRMDSVMKEGPLFTGVGAAHLPGENGLIHLLEAQGYKLRPVTGRETAEGNKIRNKLEKKIFPHTTSLYCPKDSLLQYQLPHSLVSVPADNEHEFLLYTDMVNGTHYSIYRLQHYAGLSGRSKEYIANQVDSILFETIPGKILVRRPVSSASIYPGVEIISRLPKGNYMQFQIYYTPLEVIICKAGGPEHMHKSAMWKDFFSSVRFLKDSHSSEWSCYKNPTHNFGVWLPPVKVIHDFDNKNTKNGTIQAYDPVDSSYYFLNVCSFTDFDYIEDDTFELSYLSDKLGKEFKARKVTKEMSGNKNTPVIKAIFQVNNDRYLQTKMVINANKYYFLGVVKEDRNDGDKFLESFELLNPETSGSDNALTDSTMFFQTTTDCANCQAQTNLKKIIEGYTLPYMKMFRDFSGEESEVYYSCNHISAVQVKREKLDRYSCYKDRADFWTSREKTLKKDKDSYIDFIGKDCRFINADTSALLSKSWILGDTTSSRSFWIKETVINDHLFTLTTIIDNSIGPNNWQTSFYNNFVPWDTCERFDLMVPKGSRFVNDLRSNDSICFAHVLYSYKVPGLLKSDTGALNGLFRFIAGDEFRALQINERLKLLEHISGLKFSKSQLLLMKDIYLQAADTFSLQLAVLEILALAKSPDAVAVIADLMKKNLPLSNNNALIQTFFYSLSDSAELAIPLVPVLIDIIQTPEYKQSVLKLLASLAVKNLFPYDVLTTHRDLFVREAQVSLKRYFSEATMQDNIDDSYGIKMPLADKQGITSSLPWLSGRGPSALACYAVILSSLYNTDPQVRALIDKIHNSGHKGLAYSCAISLYHNRQKQSDTTWLWLAADDDARMHFYDWLEITHDTVLYPEKYYNQQDMSLSWLMESTDEVDKDSIQFIKKVMISNKKEKGYLYFFIYKVEDEWKLNYVGLQPADTTIMYSDFWHGRQEGIDLVDMTDKSIDDAVQQAIDKVRVFGRKFVNDGDSWDLNSYFLNNEEYELDY